MPCYVRLALPPAAEKNSRRSTVRETELHTTYYCLLSSPLPCPTQESKKCPIAKNKSLAPSNNTRLISYYIALLGEGVDWVLKRAVYKYYQRHTRYRKGIRYSKTPGNELTPAVPHLGTYHFLTGGGGCLHGGFPHLYPQYEGASFGERGALAHHAQGVGTVGRASLGVGIALSSCHLAYNLAYEYTNGMGSARYWLGDNRGPLQLRTHTPTGSRDSDFRRCSWG